MGIFAELALRLGFLLGVGDYRLKGWFFLVTFVITLAYHVVLYLRPKQKADRRGPNSDD